jgi:hypothetical protein
MSTARRRRGWASQPCGLCLSYKVFALAKQATHLESNFIQSLKKIVQFVKKINLLYLIYELAFSLILGLSCNENLVRRRVPLDLSYIPLPSSPFLGIKLVGFTSQPSFNDCYQGVD